jgi:hypothetical protein
MAQTFPGTDPAGMAPPGNPTTIAATPSADGAGALRPLSDQRVIDGFAAHTLIDTPNGPVPVETLCVGDLVTTLHTGPRPVKWTGEGKVPATRGRRTAATPVIVCRGALGDNQPYEDLRLTRTHALYIDGVLIPVECLINHKTIIWDDQAGELEIHHIELETHDILLANGVPAESWRDDGNRWLFRNANTAWHQPPQPPCAPVLASGPLVDDIWRRLLQRVGHRDLPPLTNDPDLHLLVDGIRLNPMSARGPAWSFHLPARPNRVKIASREAVPAELGLARDFRSLGVALRHITLRQDERTEILHADDPSLTDGFHAYESDNTLRWTNGYATLPTEPFAAFHGPIELVLTLAQTTTYPDDGDTWGTPEGAAGCGPTGTRSAA